LEVSIQKHLQRLSSSRHATQGNTMMHEKSTLLIFHPGPLHEKLPVLLTRVRSTTEAPSRNTSLLKRKLIRMRQRLFTMPSFSKEELN
jgi:hypothetical protein